MFGAHWYLFTLQSQISIACIASTRPNPPSFRSLSLLLVYYQLQYIDTVRTKDVDFWLLPEGTPISVEMKSLSFPYSFEDFTRSIEPRISFSYKFRS